MSKPLSTIKTNEQQNYINKEVEAIINNNKLIIKKRDNINEPVCIKTPINKETVIEIKCTSLMANNYIKTNKGYYNCIKKEYTKELLKTLIEASLNKNIIINWIEDYIKEPVKDLEIIDEEQMRNEQSHSHKTRYIINDKILELEFGTNYQSGSYYMKTHLDNEKSYSYDWLPKSTYDIYTQDMKSMNNALYEQKRLKMLDN